MSLAGLKKQFNKANQFVNEKIGGVQGTQLDHEYVEMEQKIDVYNRTIDELTTTVTDYLQPNTAYKAKMLATGQISKFTGAGKRNAYPQTETAIAESMIGRSKELGPSAYKDALQTCGESFKQLAEEKYTLEENVRQKFLDPLTVTKRELTEIAFHRKKLEGRRLDFDCKKRTGGVTNDELSVAEQKFHESKSQAELTMTSLLDSDPERIHQLSGLVEAMITFHMSSIDHLRTLQSNLERAKADAASRPSAAAHQAPSSSVGTPDWPNRQAPGINGGSGGSSMMNTPPPPPMRTASPGPVPPQAKALFDFDAESAGELSFKQNDIIMLTEQLDENWFQGTLRGKSGHFPTNYVEVIVPLKK